MSKKCPLCLSEVDDNNPGLLADKIDKAVNWDNCESDDSRYGYPIGKRFNILDVGDAEVVAKKVGYDTGDVGDYYGGELPQGTEFETFVVLKVRDHFYKKTGTGDSYGSVSWDGFVRPVTPKTKTVTVYDFEA